MALITTSASLVEKIASTENQIAGIQKRIDLLTARYLKKRRKLEVQKRQLEDTLESYHAMVQFREMGHAKRRDCKRHGRYAACEARHIRSGGPNPVVLEGRKIRASNKVKRMREHDKKCKARRERQTVCSNRYQTMNLNLTLTPGEIEFFRRKAEARKAAEEGHRTKGLAYCSPDVVVKLLNGDLGNF
jgi:hypothetical protein